MTRNEISDTNLLDPALYRSGMPYELYDEVRAAGSVRWHPETLRPVVRCRHRLLGDPRSSGGAAGQP